MKTSNPSLLNKQKSTVLQLFFCCCGAWSSTISAYEVSDGFHINPFLSQSMVHTSDNNFHGNSDDSVTLKSNEIGAVFSYSAHDALSFSAQIMARQAGEMDEGDILADYYFAQYRIAQTLDHSLSVRLGKLRLPYGFYNETRDVTSTNAGIIMPQSIYIDRGRNTYFAADGVMLHGENFWNDISITWDLGTAKIETDDDEISDLAGFPAEEGAEGAFKPAARIILGFDNDAWRIGYSYRESDFEFTPELTGVRFSPSNQLIKGQLLSLQYTAEEWTLTAEWTHADVKTNLSIDEIYMTLPFPFPPAWLPVNQGSDFEFPAENYYVQLEYRLNPSFKIMLRRDDIYASRHDRDGEEMADALNGIAQSHPALAPLGRPAYSQYAKDHMLGLTWNISPHAIARIEWHNVEGTFWLSGHDNPDRFDTKKYWDMLAVQFGYRF